MPTFQARSTTRARPPMRCSQKSHRPSASPTRKLPNPLVSSNISRSRMATLTARAFMVISLALSKARNCVRGYSIHSRAWIFVCHTSCLAGRKGREEDAQPNGRYASEEAEGQQMLLIRSYEEFRISSEDTLEDPVFRRVVLDRGDHRLRWFVYFSGDPPYLRHGSFGSVFLPAE